MKRKEIIAANKISELCELSLFGYTQKVLIEGKSDALPVLITLHGGPGTPIPFSVGCRGLLPAFTDNFIMVYWDQLGCGINNRVIDDTFTIDAFVRMVEDLVGYIKKLFPDNKIMIFSMSWGSILSLRLLEKNPYAVDAIVACGQIIKNVFLCDEVINALSETKIPKSKLDRIKNMKADSVTSKDLQLISGALRKYTNAYQNKTVKQSSKMDIIWGLLTSPDYSFKDFKAIMLNGYMKNMSLWREILSLDLSDILMNVEIPYYILQGETDIVASTGTVREVLERSGNKNLSLEIVANTGHMPSDAMSERLLCILKELIR